ncbi:Stk1 family PASTA domain-containing Ser/Thr kinase [Jonesia quinghaiensis]|uniref:Stk1 family PASTA domain-containing Ser/Thr kinase n=1 Tax=Jonesia quinghaiensis TaxID=262806 RepID=UPI00040EEF52|nr:Stk1 family PASTA domain-containing Ser/Thr kinase [Jonesia quinghaiensis]
MTSSTNDPLTDRLIDGRYRVLGKIARGGMATVYRALDTRLGREVAVKVMHSHLAEGSQGSDFIARFRREARAAARLAHPGLVAVYDQGHDGDLTYLTMELVTGPTLRAALDVHQALPAEQALAITQSVLEALSVAHAVGMVHRDIKPENVLLSESGTVKLTDFGLARAVTDASSTATGTVFGTVAYIGPELVTHGTADSRTDIYSVGIMLFEMLTGRQPFTADTPVHVAFRHINEDVPAPSSTSPHDCPPSLDALVAQYTARDPQHRPAHAHEALTQLRPVYQELFEAAHPTVSAMTRRTRNEGPGSPVALAQLAQHTATHAPSPHTPAPGTSILPLPTSDADITADELGQEQDSAPGTTVYPTISSPPTSITPQGNAQRPGHPTPLPENSTTALPAAPLNSTRAMPLTALPIDGDEQPRASRGAPQAAQKEKAPPAPHTRRKGRIAILAIIAVLFLSGGAFGGTYWWNEHGPGSYTTVPTVAGMPADDLDALFDQHPLTYTVEEVFSDTVEEGQVIGSSPEGGEQVKKESDIAINVSLGIQYLEVPGKLTGQPVDEVEELLASTGFTEVKVTRAYDTRTAKDTVLTVSVQEGKSLPHNTPITLTVSDGPEPITIPTVTGKERSVAQKELEALDLSVSETTANSDTVAKGTVMSQDPASGTESERGAKITLTVSDGPELVKVPDVTGKSREEAEEILEDLDFDIEVKEYLEGFFGLVRFQDVNAGTEVPKGSTITLTVF